MPLWFSSKKRFLIRPYFPIWYSVVSERLRLGILSNSRVLLYRAWAFESVSNQGESLGKANLVLKKNLLGTRMYARSEKRKAAHWITYKKNGLKMETLENRTNFTLIFTAVWILNILDIYFICYPSSWIRFLHCIAQTHIWIGLQTFLS